VNEYLWFDLSGDLTSLQECMIGFVFADEKEAKNFFKKVQTKKVKCVFVSAFSINLPLTISQLNRLLLRRRKSYLKAGNSTSP
jgi:hypothetical protein